MGLATRWRTGEEWSYALFHPIGGPKMTRQVLVIEDDEDIATLVKLHLAELSCAVKLIRDGAAGLAEVGSKPYDLVVLDLMLPGVDGLEICRRIRASACYTP